MTDQHEPPPIPDGISTFFWMVIFVTVMLVTAGNSTRNHDPVLMGITIVLFVIFVGWLFVALVRASLR